MSHNLCNQCYNHNIEIFHHPRKFLCTVYVSPLPEFQFLSISSLLSVTEVLSFRKFHVDGVIQHVVFCVWFLYHHKHTYMPTYIHTYIQNQVLNILLCELHMFFHVSSPTPLPMRCMDVPQSVYPLTTVQFAAIRDNAAVNIHLCVQMCFPFSLGKYLGVEGLSHTLAVCFNL